jgi:hypothetical protein
MQLIKRFSTTQYTRALESWGWLDIAGKTPLFASQFGDVFLQATDGVWFLDSIGGSLERRWESLGALEEDLASPEAQDRYLLAGLTMAAERAGKALGPDQIYDIVPPPALGGAFVVEHVFVADFVVTLNIAGQLHEQIRGLPPGTPISSLKIAPAA